MSDALLRTPAEAAPLAPLPALPELPVPAVQPGANDNDEPTPPQQPEARMFELPANVWVSMVSCYAIFLLALLGASGGAHVVFAIAIAAVYVAMFFGTARVMLKQAPEQPGSGWNGPEGVLHTLYGPVTRGDALGQILLVPAVVAFFGVAVAAISALLA